MVQHDSAGFNVEGAANGQAVGALLTGGMDVHMCPVMGMEKPCCTPATVGSIYDSVLQSAIGASWVDMEAGSEIDGPSEFDLATMMAARTGAAPRVSGDDKYVAVYYDGRKPAISTAQWRPSSWCSESRGGIEAYIAGLILTDLVPTAATRGFRGPGGMGGGRGDG